MKFLQLSQRHEISHFSLAIYFSRSKQSAWLLGHYCKIQSCCNLKSYLVSISNHAEDHEPLQFGVKMSNPLVVLSSFPQMKSEQSSYMAFFHSEILVQGFLDNKTSSTIWGDRRAFYWCKGLFQLITLMVHNLTLCKY